MTNHDQFDELLDHVLTEYRDAEPLAGLEDRVLQRLQSQTIKRRSPWWIRGAIATCAALVLIVLGITLGTPSRHLLAGWGSRHVPLSPKQETAQTPLAPPPTATSHQQEITTQAAIAETPTPHRPRISDAPIARAEVARTSAATTSQFPTPAPLTTEEHALLALLHANPDALPKPREDSDDTTIAPLEIKPLDGSAAPTQENSNE